MYSSLRFSGIYSTPNSLREIDFNKKYWIWTTCVWPDFVPELIIIWRINGTVMSGVSWAFGIG